MDDTRVSALAVLKETMTIIFKERGLFFQLISLLSILTILFFWPVLDLYAEFLTPGTSPDLFDEETSAIIFDRIYYLAFLIWPYLFLTYGALVIWSRAAIGGTGVAMDGGRKALFIRTARAFWRLLCGLGWILLVGLGSFIVVFFLLTLLGIAGIATVNPDAGGEIPGLIIVLLAPMYILSGIAVVLITLLIAVSIHAESREVSLPIRRCYHLMKGNRLRAAGVLFLVGLVYEFFFMVLSAVVIGAFIDASLVFFVLGFFILFMLGLAYQLVWITYGAVYAITLVPELKP